MTAEFSKQLLSCCTDNQCNGFYYFLCKNSMQPCNITNQYNLEQVWYTNDNTKCLLIADSKL